MLSNVLKAVAVCFFCITKCLEMLEVTEHNKVEQQVSLDPILEVTGT